MADILKQVKSICRTHDLLSSGDSVLVALSGGADSVCLLALLLNLSKEFSFSVSAAHMHHGLRGEAADGDETFSKQLCLQLGVPFYSHREDVRVYAKKHGVGLEEAGRELRYDYFNRLADEHGFSKIATAHHAGDNVETVLMHILRGTGLDGLGGIPYKNGRIIRPLLDVTKQEIEAFLNVQKLSFRTDHSNFDTSFTRNRIRHELLPLILKEFNPNFQQTFSENIKLFGACGAYVNAEVEKKFENLSMKTENGFMFDAKSLLKEGEFMAKSLLALSFAKLSGGQRAGLSAAGRAYSLLVKASGSAEITGEVKAWLCHGRLYVQKEQGRIPFFYSIDVEDDRDVLIEETGDRFIFSKTCEKFKKPDANEVYLDLKKLSGKKIAVRSRQAGDTFCPVGMKGHKSLKSFLIDKKIPRFLRDEIPIVTADDEIVWVAGLRADRRFVAEQSCLQSLHIRMIKRGHFYEV